MVWTVYCHTHVESGRKYVGLTRLTMLKRWNRHFYSASRQSKSRSHFGSAIRKYGKNAFSHEVLQTCETLEEANQAEIDWIEKLNTRDPKFGFNLAPGGQHAPHPEKRNPWNDPAFRERVTASVKKSFEDPVRRQQALDHARELQTRPGMRERIAAKLTGNVLSPETRAKIGAKSAARRHSPETLEKFKTTNRRDLSPEARQRIADSCREFWRKKREADDRSSVHVTMNRRAVEDFCTSYNAAEQELSDLRADDRGSLEPATGALSPDDLQFVFSYGPKGERRWAVRLPPTADGGYFVKREHASEEAALSMLAALQAKALERARKRRDNA